MSGTNLQEYSTTEINQMTDEEVASLTHDPTLSAKTREYLQYILLMRYEGHLKTFFPEL